MVTSTAVFRLKESVFKRLNTHTLKVLTFLAVLLSSQLAALDKKDLFSSFTIPVSFERNEGQTDPSVKFLSRGSKSIFHFTSNELMMTSFSKTSRSVLKMKFVNANSDALLLATQELDHKSNYFIGNDPKKWQTNIPNYSKLSYHNLYPGIDAVFYGNQHQMEYDFCVAPGGNPNHIRIKIDGSKDLFVDQAGNLHIISASNQDIQMLKPMIYQMIDGKKQNIHGAFTLLACNEIGFNVDQYDVAQTLIIDPILSYSTYFGGTVAGDFNEAASIAVDSSGSAYITGASFGATLPTTSGAYQTTPPNPFTVGFVTKFNPTGTDLIYSTYIGGNTFDNVLGIAIDSSGNAYITGQTASTNYPTVNAFQSTLQGFGDAFVTKFNSTGSGLLYSTYLGGSIEQVGEKIKVDSSGSAYIVGETQSTNFPTTPGAFQTVKGAGFDAFVTKFTPAGDQLSYSTFLGGNGNDFGRAIDIDSSGNAYVTGETASTDFPLVSPFQSSFVGSSIGFVTKFNAAGTGLFYSTYLGEGSTSGSAIALDINNNAYVTGRTDSDFPTTSGAFQETKPNPPFNTAGFITAFDATGTALKYSTYLAGSIDEAEARGIAVNHLGEAFVGGITASPDFPVTPNALQPTRPSIGSSSGFITKLNSSGSNLIYSSYLGGTALTRVNAVALDTTENPYLTGGTRSTDFPVTPGAFQTTLVGSFGAFVTKMNLATPIVTAISPTEGPEVGGTEVTITGQNFTDATAVNFGSNPAIAFTVDSDTQITAISPAGTGVVDVTVTTPGGTSPTSPADRFTYIPVPNITGVSPNSGPETGGTEVIITGTGFTGAEAVNFGSNPALSFTIDSDIQITAISPAGIGTVDVTVTTLGGTSPISPADQFTYIPTPVPNITGVSPNSGPETGGTVVIITGTGFTGATAVSFGGNPALSFTVDSDTQITAISPAGTGTVDVTVTTPGGTSPISPADQFTYEILINPPTHLRGVQVVTEFLLQTEYANVLTWDPPASGLEPVAYRIYRDPSLTRLVAEIPATRRLRFVDHNRRPGKTYTYFVVSISDTGDVSEPAFVVVRPRN